MNLLYELRVDKLSLLLTAWLRLYEISSDFQSQDGKKLELSIPGRPQK